MSDFVKWCSLGQAQCLWQGGVIQVVVQAVEYTGRMLLQLQRRVLGSRTTQTNDSENRQQDAGPVLVRRCSRLEGEVLDPRRATGACSSPWSSRCLSSRLNGLFSWSIENDGQAGGVLLRYDDRLRREKILLPIRSKEERL